MIIPLWFKLAYTAFVLYVMAVWWKHYGWKNFLWFSDIAFIGAVPAMWLESAPLSSVLTVAVLVPELLWNVDYVLRLLLRRRITGLTDYMFEPERPLLLRGLSLFHVPLPLVLLWLIAAYGYDASVGAARSGRARGHRAAVEPDRQHLGEEHQLDLRFRRATRALAGVGLRAGAVPRLRAVRISAYRLDPQTLRLIGGRLSRHNPPQHHERG